MGKKSSQKKKQHKQMPVQQQSVQSAGRQLGSLSGEQQVTPVTQNRPGNSAVIDTTDFIRSDIRRIAMLLVAMVVILAGLVALNHKSTVLSKAGRKLTSFMKLQ